MAGVAALPVSAASRRVGLVRFPGVRSCIAAPVGRATWGVER